MQHQNAIMMSAQDALPTPLWPSSQLATGLSPLAPRSGLERSDFVHWHRRDDYLIGTEETITCAGGSSAYWGEADSRYLISDVVSRSQRVGEADITYHPIMTRFAPQSALSQTFAVAQFSSSSACDIDLGSHPTDRSPSRGTQPPSPRQRDPRRCGRSGARSAAPVPACYLFDHLYPS